MNLLAVQLSNLYNKIKNLHLLMLLVWLWRWSFSKKLIYKVAIFNKNMPINDFHSKQNQLCQYKPQARARTSCTDSAKFVCSNTNSSIAWSYNMITSVFTLTWSRAGFKLWKYWKVYSNESMTFAVGGCPGDESGWMEGEWWGGRQAFEFHSWKGTAISLW